MASSFIEFKGRGFWDSDGALRDLLALLLVELDARGLRKKQAELWEHWTLQAYVFFTGAQAHRRCARAVGRGSRCFLAHGWLSSTAPAGAVRAGASGGGNSGRWRWRRMRRRTALSVR
jgi:hypothetical protein